MTNSVYIKQYTSDMKKQWDDHICHSKNGTFLFYRDYMEYHADRFEDASLFFYNDDVLLAVLPANISQNMIYTHQGLTYGGLVCIKKIQAPQVLACFDALMTWIKSKKLTALIYKRIPYIYCSYPSDEDLYALFRHQAVLIRRDLSTALDLRNPLKVSKGKKYTLSRARKQPLTIQECPAEGVLDILNTTLNTKYNTQSTHSSQEMDLLMSRFPKEIRCFGSFLDSSLVAGVITYDCGETVHVQYLASNDWAKEHGAMDAIIHFLFTSEYAQKSFFEFGISTENNGQDLNIGLIQQKELFGGRGICYDTYKIVV